MKRLLLVAILVFDAFAASAIAQGARTVTVHVVDVAGGRAYLDAGEDAGIVVGTEVRIGDGRFPVTATTHGSSVVSLGDAQVAVGDRGTARATEVSAQTTEVRRAEAAPLDTLREQWTPRATPASTQQPEYVPLGVTGQERRARFLLASSTVAYLPLGGGTALLRENIRGRVHAEPIRNVPFAIDADATLQLYAARDLGSLPGGNSRPILRVQRLATSYGREQDFFVGLGRLWTAAQGVGMLDGVRIHTPSIGGVTLGAFGGLVPRLFDNRPSLDAARFGIEAGYRNLELRARPSIDVVAQGSFFQGSIDERRLSTFASLSPEIGRFGAYGVVDLHDRNNPWMSHSIEVNAAGASASLRSGRWEGGVRVDYRRPDRSRFLASQLPTAWMCGGIGSGNGSNITTPTIAASCQTHGDGRYFVSADTGVRLGAHTMLAGGGSYVRTPASQVNQGSGFVQLRLAGLADVGRINVTASAYAGSLLISYALALEGGASLRGGLVDFTVHYRPSASFYTAEIKPGIDHLFGANLRIDPGHAVTAGFSLDTFLGHDVHAILAQCTIAYRPDVR